LRFGQVGVPGTPQLESGGTVQLTSVALQVPPLSALMQLMPGSSGSCTVMFVGAGAGPVPDGHSGVISPCGTVHGRPKFGPPLQMPVGFWRQNESSGLGC
jgi:hypothetical protein